MSEDSKEYKKRLDEIERERKEMIDKLSRSQEQEGKILSKKYPYGSEFKIGPITLKVITWEKRENNRYAVHLYLSVGERGPQRIALGAAEVVEIESYFIGE